tara:strand:- start:1182 stop:1484 length:303 start_codon:yes stop_codon:yes gene_type:complete
MNEKNLKIQINSVKRLIKENKHYTNEIISLENTIKQMTQNDPDNYDVNKTKEILEETVNTQKYTQTLIQSYTNKLKETLTVYLENGNISNSLLEEINCIE